MTKKSRQQDKTNKKIESHDDGIMCRIRYVNKCLCIYISVVLGRSALKFGCKLVNLGFRNNGIYQKHVQNQWKSFPYWIHVCEWCVVGKLCIQIYSEQSLQSKTNMHLLLASMSFVACCFNFSSALWFLWSVLFLLL